MNCVFQTRGKIFGEPVSFCLEYTPQYEGTTQSLGSSSFSTTTAAATVCQSVNLWKSIFRIVGQSHAVECFRNTRPWAHKTNRPCNLTFPPSYWHSKIKFGCFDHTSSCLVNTWQTVCMCRGSLCRYICRVNWPHVHMLRLFSAQRLPHAAI